MTGSSWWEQVERFESASIAEAVRGPASIRARPTLYRGIRMRSRLEARVAGHLDQIGIPWLYEPDCFASQDRQYLPDFELWPDDTKSGLPRAFLEIKPASIAKDPGAVERAKRGLLTIRDSIPDAWLCLWIVDSAWIYNAATAWVVFPTPPVDLSRVLESLHAVHQIPSADRARALEESIEIVKTAAARRLAPDDGGGR